MPSNKTNEDIAEAIAQSLDLDWDDVGDDIADEVEPVARGAGRQLLVQIGNEDAFSVVDAFAVDYAKRRGADLVGRKILSDGTVVDNPSPAFAITESTRDMVREKLISALDAGSSVHELRTAIMDDVFGVSRALVIARTEVSFAHNQGQLEGAKESGLAYKAWYAADDEAECEDCQGNADEGVLEISDGFSSGDDAPPVHPNCRCSLVYYSADDEEALDAMGDEDSV